tara:strand:- start:4050 stop:6161 length:2112 start_codon:yes stop_codon:yes gene_type:complete
MDLVLIGSFILFMTAFAGIGLASMLVKEDTTDDYLVAGRGMHPALAALSAVSTWNSGYMFIGYIGFTFTMGYSIVWIAFGSMAGQILAWIWLYKFIQQSANERGLRSLSSLVSEATGSPEAKLAAVLSILFLSVYAAAQLTSGGKALYVMLGWSEVVGILIGFVLVVAYCYAGGIRASIWTDAAQSSVMILGSSLLCWVALEQIGGFSGLHSGLDGQNANLTSIVPADLGFGVTLWAFAFFLGGLSVAGQPQVVTRVMTLGTDRDRKTAMLWFFAWQTPFLLIMTIIGLSSRVVFSGADFDPELGLPMLAMETLGPFWVGLILASIFAATMSTADSQVLACTAAFTDDVMTEISQDHKKTKMVTLVVAAFATAISIFGLYVPGGDSVFSLVVLAVYGLGSIFVPILIIRWSGYEPDTTHTTAMMIAALTGVIAWRLMGLNDEIFESIPGMGAAFVTHFVMNQIRSSDVSPLGRFDLPEGQKLKVIAASIIIPFSAIEVTYFLAGPDSYEYQRNNEYLIDFEEGMITWVDNTTVELSDGEVFSFSLTDQEFPEEAKERNIFSVDYTVTVLDSFDDNEETNGPGCVVDPGQDEADSVSLFVSAPSNTSSLETQSSVYDWIDLMDFPQFETFPFITGYTVAEIEMSFDTSDSVVGDYSFEFTGNVESGDSTFQCDRQDSTVTIEYLIELWWVEPNVLEWNDDDIFF